LWAAASYIPPDVFGDDGAALIDGARAVYPVLVGVGAGGWILTELFR
jgi:hypothetical protein